MSDKAEKMERGRKILATPGGVLDASEYTHGELQMLLGESFPRPRREFLELPDCVVRVNRIDSIKSPKPSLNGVPRTTNFHMKNGKTETTLSSLEDVQKALAEAGWL